MFAGPHATPKGWVLKVGPGQGSTAAESGLWGVQCPCIAMATKVSLWKPGPVPHSRPQRRLELPGIDVKDKDNGFLGCPHTLRGPARGCDSAPVPGLPQGKAQPSPQGAGEAPPMKAAEESAGGCTQSSR